MSGGAVISVKYEDYGAPPCKRQRKEDEPHNKSIKNYFSPVSKSIEKVVTSPRSHNIADYFIKSSPIIEECTPSPEHGPHPTKNGQLPPTPLSSSSKASGRLGKPVKRTRLLRRLGDTKEEDGSCSPPATEVSGNTGFLGSDTAALLAEICSKAEDLDEENERPKSSKPNLRERSLKRKPVTPGDPPPGVEAAACRSVGSESTASEASLEAPVDNTTTISFEDFIKSQAECDPEHPELPNEPKTSPKTVTIQAQVHLSPPMPGSCSPSRGPTKIASIFCKKKPGGGECTVSATPKSDHVIPKRKSNVVIEEEDLELAVIDLETMEPTKPKSTAAERQQFMKAFRQAGDTQKNSAKRPTGKKKDANTTEGADDLNHQEHGEESTHKEGQEEAPAETKPEEQPKLKPATKKTTKNTHSEVTPSLTERPLPQPHEATESPQQSPVLRRSLRRRRAVTTSTSPEHAANPVLMSTPKIKTPSRKNDHYKAEVLTASSDTQSPIRMRFTRISRRISGRHSVPLCDDEAFTPGRKKISSSTKKINKAKQILEKAKAIQQNIAKMDAPQRRSARLSQEHSSSKTPISQPKEAKVTNLRSLNDVLGKKEKTKGSGQKKEIGKRPLKSVVITIDDGSEVSENSQDDEQFKAKRDFLMSGLPDSLKRHIAKEAALREAYTLSSLSFHSVVHVQQRDGCEKWNLGMPPCPLLTKLLPGSMNVSDVTSVTLSVGDFTSCSPALSLQKLPDLMIRRAAFSEAIRNCLLEEIRWSNPQFPVRKFFTQFLKKQTDYLALQDASKPGGHPEDQDEAAEEAKNGAKRKRKDSPGLKSKRRKGTPGKDEPDGESAGKARKGRLSRGSLKRNVPVIDPDIVVIEDEATAKPGEEGPALEDVLWTEKYQPQSSTELIGNSVAIRKLHSWLRDWKTRAEKEEKRSQMQKPGKDKNDTWDLDDFNDEDSDEDSLCNTMLITGPPGVGKTAAVYACAQELGFKVFEVNASCQRSGRQILAQLKEATQSHQVDQQGVNAHKPCFFSSYSLGKSPRKVHSPKAVVSSPRKPPMSPRGGKKGLAPKSLANFFKAAPKSKAAPDHGKATPTISDGKVCANKAVKPLPFFSDKGAEETQRKSATSLILFEEVDVIFDEDSGFLSAIKTFMSTTKRPVILTTSDEMFGMMFDGVFEEITFHTPSVVNVASYLQVLCLAENLRMDTKDLMTFLTTNKCDIRQSVLQLQFWARSGGGGLREKALPPAVGSSAAEDEAAKISNTTSEIDLGELPQCNFGCAENLMGLGNMLPAEGLIPFVKGKISKPDWLDRITPLLSEFQSRNKDFISSNLEYLLPLPLCVEEHQASSPSAEAVEQAAADEDDEMKMSAQMKRRKKLVLLNDSDLFDSSSCSLDGNPLDKIADDPTDGGPSNRKKSHNAPVRRKLSPAELTSSSLVYTCLDSLASLADDLSYVDCSTCEAADQGGACNLNWTESRLRHGLCDSLRIESGGEMIAHSADEIRAYIEGLSLHKCSSHLTRALDGSLRRCKQSGHDPTQELTLHVSKSQDEVYIGQPFTTTSTAESRLSTVRTVLSNRAFMTLGNRQTNVTEYLPALRSICRIEKAKEEGKTKRRFLHYLEGIHLEFPKTTLTSLAADFP